MTETRQMDILGLATATLLALVLSVGASAAMFSGFAGFSGFAETTGFAGSYYVEGPEPIVSGATLPALQMLPQFERLIPADCFAKPRQAPLRGSFY